MVGYIVASPSEILAITGSYISDIKLTKKKLLWPFQKCVKVDISPVNYTFDVQAMSIEKLPFVLPAVFTIGPRADDYPSLLKYTKLMSSHDKMSNHVTELVRGIIEGETRVLAASMTMEQIFNGTKEFKQQVFDKVQLELDQFGLHIYNANVKQLVDVPGHEYFSYLGQKTQMEAANKAKIDVAEATMHGEIGAKAREGSTVQNAAKIDAETKIAATKRQGERQKEEINVKTDVEIFQNQRAAEVAEANAELAKKKAGWTQIAKVAEVEATKAVDIREAELQKEVELKNAMAQTEKLKAEYLSKASVDYEIKIGGKGGPPAPPLPAWGGEKTRKGTGGKPRPPTFGPVQEANSAFYNNQKVAEGVLFEKVKNAEAQRALADAAYYSRQQAANGDLYAKMKEAEGITAIADAQGRQLETLLKAVNGNYASLRDYMMLSSGLFQDIAKINGQAIQGLQPKISIWSGANGGDGGTMKDVAGLYKMLPPLFQTVHEQTGMVPPPWLGTLPEPSTKSTSNGSNS
ncbi:hypothetical protein Leryth_011984 [Lithospermum erythrorhizon]|nr:hypothetical protein Leryth_011984 [Lithospermum erythrorhizon]